MSGTYFVHLFGVLLDNYLRHSLSMPRVCPPLPPTLHVLSSRRIVSLGSILPYLTSLGSLHIHSWHYAISDKISSMARSPSKHQFLLKDGQELDKRRQQLQWWRKWVWRSLLLIPESTHLGTKGIDGIKRRCK